MFRVRDEGCIEAILQLMYRSGMQLFFLYRHSSMCLCIYMCECVSVCACVCVCV